MRVNCKDLTLVCGLTIDFFLRIFTQMAVRVEWTKDSGGRWKMEEVPDSEKFFPAQLVFLALGFLGPQNQILQALNIKQDARSNVQTPLKVRASRGHATVRHLCEYTEILDKC